MKIVVCDDIDVRIGGQVLYFANCYPLFYLPEIMARPFRVEFDGGLYDVTSRGNARDYIFDEDGAREPTDCPGGASLRI